MLDIKYDSQSPNNEIPNETTSGDYLTFQNTETEI
jgi:hypothetical protein